MLEQQIYIILYSVLNLFHTLVFALFGFAIIRIFLAKVAPYSSMWVGSVAFIQSIYNGCPVTDIVNFFAFGSGNLVISNEFLFIFFDWYWASRILIFLLSLLLLYNSYITWNKPRTIVDFSRIIRFSNLTALLRSVKSKKALRV